MRPARSRDQLQLKSPSRVPANRNHQDVFETRDAAGGALVSLSAVLNSETGLCAGSSNEASSLKGAAP